MKVKQIGWGVMVILPLIFPFGVWADTEKVGDYTWQYFVRDGKAWIGSQQCEVAAISPNPIGEITVPSRLGDYAVYGIDSNALYGCDGITKLTIPNCVTNIAKGAFRGCRGLYSVTLPFIGFERGNTGTADSLFGHVFGSQSYDDSDAIDQYYNAVSCTRYYIPKSLREVTITDETTLGYAAFCFCSRLTNVTLPNSLTNIKDGGAFWCCSELTDITIPTSVTNIGSSAFRYCSALKGVSIGDATISIGEHAFGGCSSLTNISVPKSVVNIGPEAFDRCAALQSMTIPFIGSCRGNNGTKEAVFGHIFGTSAQAGLTSVVQAYNYKSNETTSHYIPSTLKKIVITDETIVAKGAFDNCQWVTNITVNEGVRHIGEWAFAHCRALKSISIPDSVTNIETSVFSDCTGLASITLPFIGSMRGNTGSTDSLFGYIFGSSSYSGGEMIRQYCTPDLSEKYCIPKSLVKVGITDETVLGRAAFCFCSRLTSVTLPNSLTDIKDGGAFWCCSGLTSVNIPTSVTNIGSGTFHQCSALKSVVVPLSVKSMGDELFVGCSFLDIVYVPRRFKGYLSPFSNCAPDLELIYYDENMKFFDEVLTAGGNSSTNILAVCTNDCRVSFKWKSSCEPMFKGNIYDYLSFEIDGVRQEYICGETDWQTKSYEVPSDGEHVFRWIYQKDEEGSAGEDCAWVKHVVVAPRVTLSFDGGEATDGVAPAAMSFYADDESVVLPSCGTLSLAKHSFAGWSDGETVYAADAVCPYQKTAQTLTAVWAANTLSPPVIVAPETYEADSTTVTITADEGATVYYTLDGSVPSADGTGYRTYQGPFEIEGSATIRAIAVKDNYYDSEIASFMVTRSTWTFGEYLNCPKRIFTTGGDAEWVRAKGVSDDGYALRSGGVSNSQTSRLETVVYGAGTIAFQCKVDGEVVKKLVFDGLAFCVDGMQQGDLMGENAWTNKSFAVTGDGRHTLSWFYVKDEEGNGGGEDCAWLDNVAWTADDPLPPLDAAATDSDAQAIIAGLSDVRLSDTISNTTAYAAFRFWVDSKGLSHALVKDAPNAWLSYMLDAPGLMAKAALTSEDVVIESVKPSDTTTGSFDLVVDIGGAEIGEGARLTAALGVEGATELDTSAFTPEGLSITLERTADSKTKATVIPTGTPSSFFMRVKVK